MHPMMVVITFILGQLKSLVDIDFKLTKALQTTVQGCYK